ETIWGRKVRIEPLDTGLTRTGNFNAYTKLCDTAFMGVASMSAFDEGIHDPVTECGIPDLRTTSTNPSIMLLPTVYSALAIRPDTLQLTNYQYWKRHYPDAIKSAAFVFVDNNTTRAQTRTEVEGSSQIGYEWTAYEPVDLAAISYKTQIRRMKNADPPVRFVAFQGAYQQAAKLAREMLEEAFIPDVFALQMNIYDPRFLVEGGQNLEQFLVHIALLSQMTEEIEGSPELQTYRRWLKFIDPEAEPTGLGNYAWSATKLTYQLLKEIGPNPTRAKMIEAMGQVEGWSADGLHPAQAIGSKDRANCVIMLEVRDASFVRIHPAEPNTFDCSGPVVRIE
ncbi:MAG: ABC transporter substrate-binding protein, partial [Nitriliruptorales bacterium]|nr:ABC transporter substrate-binding protein [Nitriliruptorales bacterium]